MRKKKILMVHNFYQLAGGEDTVFKSEAEMLRENGHEVIEYTRRNDELKNSKLKLLLLPFTATWSFKTFRDVKKIIKSQSIDIVHCHNTFPLISPSVYYAARSQKVPVIQTIHNFRFLCPAGVLYRDGSICEECMRKASFKPALKHNCYRNSRIQTLTVTTMLSIHRRLGTYKKINYIFLTEFNKQKFEQLIDIHAENVFVKPNFAKALPKAETNTSLNGARKLSGNKLFVFYGRLEKNKGILSLLEMWKKLPKDYILHIYGTGSCSSDAKQAAAQFSNITFYGFMPRQVIFRDILQSTAVLIMSEWYEGFIMSIPESFSLAAPVVCTDLGNLKSIIEESNAGVTYKMNHFDSFYAALNQVINNNAVYSANALLYFEQKLSDKINYKLLCDIYEKAKVI